MENSSLGLPPSSFDPGKRENAFYIKSSLSKINRFSNPIRSNSGYYSYEWDEVEQKHVKRWVES